MRRGNWLLSLLILAESMIVPGCGSSLQDWDDMKGQQEPCREGESNCDGCCTVLASDPNNCGSCDYHCGTAPCNAGVCGAPPIVVLNLKGEWISGLTSDATHIYWTTDYSVHRMAHDGSAGKWLGSGGTSDSNRSHIALSNGRVYWDWADKVLSVPIEGGSTQVVATGMSTINGMAADSSGVYWNDMASGAIWRSQGDASTLVQLASGQDRLVGMALDDSYVYWGSWNGTVTRIPKQGGEPSVVVSEGADYHLAANAHGLYFSVKHQNSYTLMLSPAGDGAIRELISQKGQPGPIASDDASVWLAGYYAGVIALPAEGGAPVAVFSGSAGRIVPGGDWLFFLVPSSGIVYKVPKPSFGR